jgi:uncharacterized membrane protein YfbV (UPF0208 family)
MAKESHKTEIGLGLAALAVAAAGIYFLSGEKGAKNRKAVKGWMLKIKGEVMERMEDMKEINEKAYSKVVDEVVKMYRAAKNVDPKELNKIAGELKGHWRKIQKDLKQGMAKNTKQVKK